MISGSDQGIIDVATGKRLAAPVSGASEFKAISSTNMLAEVNDSSQKITFRDSRTLHPLYSASFGVDLTNAIAFSPDGQILAAGDTTGKIRMWDVRNRRPFGIPLTGLLAPSGVTSDAVLALAFSANGDAVLSIDDRGRLRRHLIGTAQIKSVLCAQFGPLSEADWKTYIPELPYRRTC